MKRYKVLFGVYHSQNSWHGLTNCTFCTRNSPIDDSRGITLHLIKFFLFLLTDVKIKFYYLSLIIEFWLLQKKKKMKEMHF